VKVVRTFAGPGLRPVSGNPCTVGSAPQVQWPSP